MDNGSDALDEIGAASAQSFPASDPPPWTLGREEENYRIEHDSMGEVHVPGDALYGAQTQRARENFPFGPRLQPEFIRALGLIKACSARVNGDLGLLPASTAAAIARAAERIAGGEHFDQFVLSVFQTGSGTSTNMNANEVIASLAGPDIHPNDHVNRSQSSNDVFPSAIHISAAKLIHGALLPAMQGLQTALEEKAREFDKVFKIGRTHLQDATPMTLGQEFGGYAYQVRAGSERIAAALPGLFELPLGGTAIGTGINAPPGFAARTIQLLAERTGLPFREADNHFEAQAARDAVLFTSAALRNYAVTLIRIANDIRWLASGPIGEIKLPDLQPGSSIMPGKVNPVIPESVLMVCAQVIGHDAAITWACAAGNFELNTMMPVIAFDLLDSISLLTDATRNFVLRCIAELNADARRAASFVEHSLAMATFLTPAIGYDKAAEIAKIARQEGRSVRDVAMEKSGLPATRIAELLGPGY